MNKNILAVLALGAFLVAPAWAANETVITTITYPDGSQEVQVQQQPRETPYAANSFEEADVNGDGRVDRREAYDSGILNIAPSDHDRNGWLDPTEYADALTRPSDVGAR